MSSTKYPCYGAVHIPGVPGIFANVIVEIDEITREVLAVTALDGSPLPNPTSSQPSTSEAAKASSAPSKKNKES